MKNINVKYNIIQYIYYIYYNATFKRNEIKTIIQTKIF